MRGAFVLAGGVVSLAMLSAAACAESTSDEALASDAGESDSALSVPEGDSAPPDAEAGIDAAVNPSRCSAAGWCETTLPDTDLVMRDLWPLQNRAFAIAESPTLGVKVLEWDDANETWEYIDDHTQNAPGMGAYAGKIWAPNDDEVYYGVQPGYIYHGTRPVPPAKAWSWTRQALPDNARPPTPSQPRNGYPPYEAMGINYPALGVWGTSRDDVYAWFTNTIFHWKSVDGAAPTWVAEYIIDDVSSTAERAFILGASGIGPDDIWFAGGRSRSTAPGCGIAVRKMSGVYRRVADAALPSNLCVAKEGHLLIEGGRQKAFLTDIQLVAPNEVVALKGARDIVKISVNGDSYSLATSNVPREVAATETFYSLWARDGSTWLSGPSRIVRGTDVWEDGGYQISTIWADGTPVNLPLYKVRGTSNENLWAIGVRYALHKTTP